MGGGDNNFHDLSIKMIKKWSKYAFMGRYGNFICDGINIK